MWEISYIIHIYQYICVYTHTHSLSFRSRKIFLLSRFEPNMAEMIQFYFPTTHRYLTVENDWTGSCDIRGNLRSLLLTVNNPNWLSLWNNVFWFKGMIIGKAVLIFFFIFKNMFSSRHKLGIMSSIKYCVLNNNNKYVHIYKKCIYI